jgi:hypothetical protein
MGTLTILSLVSALILLVSLISLWRIQHFGLRSARQEELLSIRQRLNSLEETNSEENDLLKSNLSIHTSQKNHIYNERKQAILSFFTSLNTWMWDGLNISVHDFNHTNFDEITQRVTNIKDFYNKTNISFAVMQLTVESEELVKSGYEAMMDTLKLHHFVESVMKTYQKTLSWEKTLLDKITSKDYDFFKLSPDMKSFYERQALENEEEKHKVLEGYNDRHWELFKQAIADRNLFRDMARDELASLEGDVYRKTDSEKGIFENILEPKIKTGENLRNRAFRKESGRVKESGY